MTRADMLRLSELVFDSAFDRLNDEEIKNFNEVVEALRAEVEAKKNCDHERWTGQYCKKCDLIWKDKDHA